MLIRNAILYPLLLTQVLYHYQMLLSLLMSIFGNSMNSNLLTVSLIFTSHSKAGIRESQQL